MTRIIFHIDVNSAYLSWTAISLLKKGEPTDLRTIPSIIGGSIEDRHGIVLAKSTPAKKHGIVTGEPIIQAMQKCPNLIAYPPDFALYSKCSRAMFDILSEYSDRIEPFSIDEGFLDYTGMEALFGPPIEAAKAIQKRILAELGFTVNIGISTNKLLAKMAGELEKPNKCITLFPEEIETKFWPLPIEDLFMVGRRTAPRLRKMGIRTVGELAAYPPLLLEKEFKNFGKLLHAYANGIDDSPVAPSVSESKSIGNSTTTPFDVTDREAAYKILLALSETVSMRLRQEKLCAEEIAVTLKTADFQVYSHQKQLPNAPMRFMPPRRKSLMRSGRANLCGCWGCARASFVKRIVYSFPFWSRIGANKKRQMPLWMPSAKNTEKTASAALPFWAKKIHFKRNK